MLLLVRHGECVANTERRYVGRSESPLTDRGERQAERLAARIAADPGLHVRRILTSPLARARRTAEAIADALLVRHGEAPGVETDGRLAELDYGDFEGQEIGHIPPVPAGRGPTWRDDSAIALPNGESLDAVSERMQSLCNELFRDHRQAAGDGSGAGPQAGDVVLVSHVVPIKLAVCWALAAPPATSWRMDLAVASITRLATNGPSPRLASFNDHAFLGEDVSIPVWR